jgi:hypothetical protein
LWTEFKLLLKGSNSRGWINEADSFGEMVPWLREMPFSIVLPEDTGDHCRCLNVENLAVMLEQVLHEVSTKGMQRPWDFRAFESVYQGFGPFWREVKRL